jgi:hypothetical protein
MDVRRSTSFGTLTKDLDDTPATIRMLWAGCKPGVRSESEVLRICALDIEQLQPEKHTRP